MMYYNTLAYVLLIFHIIFVPLYVYLVWNFKYWQKRGVCTARPITLFGTFPSIITRKRNTVFDIHEVYLKYKRKNRVVGVFALRTPELLILDPKLANEILVTNFRQYHANITSSWINNRKADKFVIRNPFWADGEEWKDRRHEAAPGLTHNKLKQALGIWQNSCRKMLKRMQELTANGSGEIKTKDVINRFAADVMCTFIWGIDAGTLTHPTEANLFMDTTDKWIDHTYKTRIYSMIVPIAPIIRTFWPFTLFPKNTDEFFSKLTKDAIEARTKQMQVKEHEKQQQQPDFLNYLLQSRKSGNLSHDDIVGHSLMVLLDGYETTAIAITHTLYYLAKYPNVQEKLRSEILSIPKNDNDEDFTYEQLMNLPYLDQCVHETLRLISVLPTFQRIAAEPVSLKISDEKTIEIPKGMILTIPVYSYHLDEIYCYVNATSQ